MFQLGEAQKRFPFTIYPQIILYFTKKNIKFMNKEQLTQLKEMLIRD